ncbi:hypothetical protein [Enterococcus casseliflavus]|uniref:hypothetical protein n=1 Tax=Enterococcus casseliflavus TaxID=37734 RepID=UPI0032E41411
MASGVEDILDQVFKVFSFLDNGTIGKIYTSMRVVSLTVLIIMIIVIAYKYILNERVDLKAGLFRAVLFVCLGVQLPGVITSSAEFAQKVYGETKNLDTTEKSTLSYSIVKENLADLQYASKNGFSRLNSETGTPKNNLSEQAFKMTDLTEVITPDTYHERGCRRLFFNVGGSHTRRGAVDRSVGSKVRSKPAVEKFFSTSTNESRFPFWEVGF